MSAATAVEAQGRNVFHEDVKRSEQARTVLFTDAIYRRYFEGFYAAVRTTSGNTADQRAGIDCHVVCTGNRRYAIDEKVRFRAYTGDVLLEVRSAYPNGHQVDGWMRKDLAIDFLAYGWLSSARGLVLPWHALKRAYLEHRKQWYDLAKGGVDGFKLIEARNPKDRSLPEQYTTHSTAVPVAALLEAVASASLVDVSGWDAA